MFRRAAVLIIVAAPLLLADTGPAASTPATKAEWLRQTAAAVLQPAHRALRDACLELARAARQLSDSPTPDALKAAQDAWRTAMIAARRVQCYQAGPLIDRDAASSFFSWRLLPGRIEAAVSSSRPIDAAWIDQMGVGTKGLFACEYLLFDPACATGTNGSTPAGKPASGSCQPAPRRLQYLAGLAQDLAQKSTVLHEDWGRSDNVSPGARFATGGQQTINHLINQMAASLEDISEEHLNLVLQLPQPIARQLDRIENARSGSSLQALSARLAGMRVLFRGVAGAGMDDYLRQLNPALHTRVEQQFDHALAALEAVALPLEEAVTTRRESLQRAYQTVHELELLFKVELASALGVTITFSSNDGD